MQAAWIVDDTDEEGSENDDSDENGMVLDGREDQFSNQEGIYDQEFEDDEDSLTLHDLDNAQNDSEMTVSILWLTKQFLLLLLSILVKL